MKYYKRRQQISRFREKIESLEKQLKFTQPELKGEAGESDLADERFKSFSTRRRCLFKTDARH